MSDLAPAAVLDAARAALAEITEAPGNRGYSHGALTDISDALDLLAARVDPSPLPAGGLDVGPRAVVDVLAERAKQRAKWGDGHDDAHDRGDLAKAATHMITGDWVFDSWPQELRRRHSNGRDRLVIAAALILAEIERLDRRTLAAGGRS